MKLRWWNRNRRTITALAGTTASTASFSSASMMGAGFQASLYQSRISKLAANIQPKVLATTSGSGNFGESGNAAFYTIDELPQALSEMSAAPSATLERVDIDLGPDRLAFYIDNVLHPEEADALAACAESILELNGHSRLAPGIHTPSGMRVNEAAHWYPSYEEAPKLMDPILQRIRHLVPPTLENDRLLLFPKLSQKVAQFKYNHGDEFNQHVDGLFPGQGANQQGDGIDEWTGVVSGMSMLFHLNDEETDGLLGGETRLWSANGAKHFDVKPNKGRVLLFRRGSPNAVLHAGLPVTSKVPKYMALINLAYGEQTGTRPMLL